MVVRVAVVVRVGSNEKAEAEMATARPAGRGLDGVRGEDQAEPAGPDGHASFGEDFAQAVHGAVDALLRGLVADAEGLCAISRADLRSK